MGICCSSSRRRKPRNEEREPLLPRYAPEVPSQSQFDKAADVLAAISAGKYPSQEQINNASRVLLSSDILKTTHAGFEGPLSKQGRQVLEDARALLQCLIVLGTEKNNDDKLQDLLWRIGRIDEVPVLVDVHINPDVTLGLEEGASRLPDEVTSKQEIADDIRTGMGSMKSLISLLITSPAFRLLLSDVFVTARDIVADVAADIAKVAAIVEVRAEQAEEVIRPADAELAGEKDRAGGVGVPALEELARAGKSVEENTAEITNLALNESEEKRRAIWSRLEDESPDRIRDTALHRITEIVRQAQESPQYTAALIKLADLFQKYIEKLVITAQTLGEAADATASNANVDLGLSSSVETDSDLSSALEDIKVLMERFSGHGLDLLGDKIMKFLKDIGSTSNSEDDFPSFIHATTEWLNYSLLQPEWIESEEGRREGERLYSWMTELLQRNPAYKADANDVMNEIDKIRDGLSRDVATSNVLSSLRTLLSDVGSTTRIGVLAATSESSKRWEQAKSELSHDVIQWVLPRLLRALQTIPLPRVEFKSDMVDAVIDKVTISSPSFIPDHIHIVNHTDLLLHASDASANAYFETSTSTRTRVTIDGLRISIEDIAYYVNVKGPFYTGWLDNGLLTVDIGQKRVEGDGVSITLDLEFPSHDSENPTEGDILRVLEAKVDVPGLTFSLDQTRHWIFNKLVTEPLLGPLVRTAVSLVLSSQIKGALEALNLKLCATRDEAVALKGANSGPLRLEDYWEALLRPNEPSPTQSSPSVDEIVNEDPRLELTTHVQTEATGKGIIRTTIVEDGEGEPQSETVLAIGIGEQILPGLGGPNTEPPPTLVEQGREALDELDQVRKKAKTTIESTRDEANDATEQIRQRAASAGERLQRKKSRMEKNPDWRSHAFDL